MADSMWKKLKRNWQLKLYMLVLAIILWFFVVANQTYETVMDVPLKVVDMKPEKVLVSDLPGAVSVRFSGVGKDLLIMKYIQSPRVELDIHTINYFYDYPVRTEFVVVPSQLEVNPLYIVGPDTVKIRLEDELVRRVPVNPQVTVKPMPGYMLSGPVTTIPDSVTVVGPRSEVRRIRAVRTEEMALEGVDKSTQESVPLTQPGENITLVPENVRATVQVDKIAERIIQRVPVELTGVPEGRGVLLEPASIDVNLRGPATRLAQMTKDSIGVWLDLSEWGPDSNRLVPEIRIPEGVDVLGTSPERVRVRLEQLESEPESAEAQTP